MGGKAALFSLVKLAAAYQHYNVGKDDILLHYLSCSTQTDPPRILDEIRVNFS